MFKKSFSVVLVIALIWSGFSNTAFAAASTVKVSFMQYMLEPGQPLLKAKVSVETPWDSILGGTVEIRVEKADSIGIFHMIEFQSPPVGHSGSFYSKLLSVSGKYRVTAKLIIDRRKDWFNSILDWISGGPGYIRETVTQSATWN